MWVFRNKVLENQVYINDYEVEQWRSQPARTTFYGY